MPAYCGCTTWPKTSKPVIIWEYLPEGGIKVVIWVLGGWPSNGPAPERLLYRQFLAGTPYAFYPTAHVRPLSHQFPAVRLD